MPIFYWECGFNLTRFTLIQNWKLSKVAITYCCRSAIIKITILHLKLVVCNASFKYSISLSSSNINQLFKNLHIVQLNQQVVLLSSYSERTFEDPLTLCILKMVTKDCYKSSIPLYWCKPQKLFQFSFVRILKASGYKLWHMMSLIIKNQLGYQ